MTCSPFFYFSESCSPSLVKDSYSVSYSEGNFEGKIAYLKRSENLNKELDENWFELLKKEGLNIRLIEYLSPSDFLVSLKFDGAISETGGRLSHAAILAREKGFPFSVVPNATKLFYQGDFVKLRKGKIERKESSYFMISALPSFFPKMTPLKIHYSLLAMNGVVSLSGKEASIIEVLPASLALSMPPSAYYSSIKKVNSSKLLSVVKMEKGLEKAVGIRMLQEVSFTLPSSDIGSFLKLDQEEDLLIDSYVSSFLKKFKEEKNREKRREMYEKEVEKISSSVKKIVKKCMK